MSQSAMRDALRYERRVELAFEEHRFYDVRRWKIAEETENVPAYGIAITQSGNTYSYEKKIAPDGRMFKTQHYWLPIPGSEIQASNNQLEQNTGYDKVYLIRAIYNLQQPVGTGCYFFIIFHNK